MTKRDKLIQKILRGKNVSYAEAEKMLLSLGYEPEPPKSGSSHVTFRKINCEKITLVKTQKELKLYLVKKIQEAINEY